MSKDQVRRDGEFLVEGFGIPPLEAARLVAREGADPKKLTRELSKHDHEVDALGSVPTPQPDEKDLVPDSDERALKPVLRRRNKRTGAG